MIGLVFNSVTFSYLILSACFTITAVFFIFISTKTRNAALMAAFFACLSAGSIASALISASALLDNAMLHVQIFVLTIAVLPVLLFAGQSIRRDEPGNWIKRAAMLAYVFLVIIALHNLAVFFLGYSISIPYLERLQAPLQASLPQILIGLLILYSAWAFSSPGLDSPLLSLRQRIAMFIRPVNKETRAGRGFAVLALLALAFTVFSLAVPERLYLFDAHAMKVFFVIWLSTLFIIHFLNYVPVQMSLIPKFTCLALALVATAFLLLGFSLPPSMGMFAVLLISILSVLVIVPVFLKWNMILPLYALLGDIERINAGDWNAGLPQTYNDEIGTLAESYTSMINTIQIAAKALRQANMSLEQKVVEQGQLLDELHAAHENLQTVSRHFIDTQEKERRLLAGELHDEIGQALTGIKLTLEMSRKSTDGARFAGEAQTLISDLVNRVNDMSLNLRPVMLDEFGLLPALLFLIDNYTRQTGVEVFFQQNGLEDRRFAPEAETAAYRIIQEALTNTARHARVSEVSVRLLLEGERMLLEIEDHGCGFDSASPARFSYGLAGMAERAALIGGELDIESSPGAGTFVWAKIPIDTVPAETPAPM